jgi:DNA recombination-dependent growth factor C
LHSKKQAKQLHSKKQARLQRLLLALLANAYTEGKATTCLAKAKQLYLLYLLGQVSIASSKKGKHVLTALVSYFASLCCLLCKAFPTFAKYR